MCHRCARALAQRRAGVNRGQRRGSHGRCAGGSHHCWASYWVTRWRWAPLTPTAPTSSAVCRTWLWRRCSIPAGEVADPSYALRGKRLQVRGRKERDRRSLNQLARASLVVGGTLAAASILRRVLKARTGYPSWERPPYRSCPTRYSSWAAGSRVHDGQDTLRPYERQGGCRGAGGLQGELLRLLSDGARDHRQRGRLRQHRATTSQTPYRSGNKLPAGVLERRGLREEARDHRRRQRVPLRSSRRGDGQPAQLLRRPRGDGAQPSAGRACG